MCVVGLSSWLTAVTLVPAPQERSCSSVSWGEKKAGPNF